LGSSTPEDCPTKRFGMHRLKDRIFLSSISCKVMDFEIYKLQKFSCDEFELSFLLART
jgi:hypothetical protein